MKRLVLILFVATAAHSSVAGQNWTPRLGIQGGILRQKPAGTGQADQVDRWELPSSGTIQSSFYLIAPLSDRIGLESRLAASPTKFRETNGFDPPDQRVCIVVWRVPAFALPGCSTEPWEPGLQAVAAPGRCSWRLCAHAFVRFDRRRVHRCQPDLHQSPRFAGDRAGPIVFGRAIAWPSGL